MAPDGLLIVLHGLLLLPCPFPLDLFMLYGRFLARIIPRYRYQYRCQEGNEDLFYGHGVFLFFSPRSRQDANNFIIERLRAYYITNFA